MISIIIPCFNSGIFLREAVESCLQTKIQDFEIIVVNDGSSDHTTLEILKGDWPQKVIILSQSNKGASSARNYGANQAKGDFLFFLDSDNRIRPDYLTKAVQAIQKHAEIGVVYAKPFFFWI